MTIDETIAHAQETADTRSDLCDECREEHRQLADWLTELKQFREETAELKKLLRLAVEEMTKQKLYADLGMMSRGALCKSCKTRSITNRFCQVCNYEYEHAEEAMKLIGDEDND